MQLKLYLIGDFDSRSVDNTQIPDEILPILRNNHELAFPKLFVITDHVVVIITLTDLELPQVPIELDLEVFQFLCVYVCELKEEVCVVQGSGWESNALASEVDMFGGLCSAQSKWFQISKFQVDFIVDLVVMRCKLALIDVLSSLSGFILESYLL
jgi:hypothetical protein